MSEIRIFYNCFNCLNLLDEQLMNLILIILGNVAVINDNDDVVILVFKNNFTIVLSSIDTWSTLIYDNHKEINIKVSYEVLRKISDYVIP